MLAPVHQHRAHPVHRAVASVPKFHEANQSGRLKLEAPNPNPSPPRPRVLRLVAAASGKLPPRRDWAMEAPFVYLRPTVEDDGTGASSLRFPTLSICSQVRSPLSEF